MNMCFSPPNMCFPPGGGVGRPRGAHEPEPATCLASPQGLSRRLGTGFPRSTASHSQSRPGGGQTPSGLLSGLLVAATCSPRSPAVSRLLGTRQREAVDGAAGLTPDEHTVCYPETLWGVKGDLVIICQDCFKRTDLGSIPGSASPRCAFG